MVEVSVMRPGLGRTTNVNAAPDSMARMAPSELSTIPAVRRRDKRVVAQWFTVDIAAVEYTQTLIQLAVGEPLRIVHKHLPLNPK